MLTTTPHLQTRRPSPTTAEFTVTTRPHQTLPQRALFLATIPLRLLLALVVLITLHSAWAASPHATPLGPPASGVTPPFFSDDFIWYAVWAVHVSPVGVFATRFVGGVPAWLLLPGCAAALYLAVARLHTTEAVLVLRGLGIQTSTSGGTYLEKAGTRFIPTAMIRDVLINEAFRGFEVRYYLVVLVEGEDDAVVVFQRLLPDKEIVEAVWRGIRGCLFEGSGVGRLDEKG